MRELGPLTKNVPGSDGEIITVPVHKPTKNDHRRMVRLIRARQAVTKLVDASGMTAAEVADVIFREERRQSDQQHARRKAARKRQRAARRRNRGR